MTNKLTDKDKKDWQNFLNSSEKLQSKDIDQSYKEKILQRSIDLHGYKLDEANKKIFKFIENCYLNGVKKINVIYISFQVILLLVHLPMLFLQRL